MTRVCRLLLAPAQGALPHAQKCPRLAARCPRGRPAAPDAPPIRSGPHSGRRCEPRVSHPQTCRASPAHT